MAGRESSRALDPSLPFAEEDIQRHMRTCAKAICRGREGARGGVGGRGEAKERRKARGRE